MDRQRVFDCLKALGYSDQHVHALIGAELARREQEKEERFKVETEELLRGMEV